MAEEVKKKNLLIDEEMYLTSGVHIGTQAKSANMKRFIYKVRTDGLYVMDVQHTDERIRIAAKFLANYEPDKILAVAARQYGQKPVKLFADTIGAKCFPGRYIPGTMTNYNIPTFFEPDVVLLTDPAVDVQALKEAVSIGVPVVALCDANNETRYVDIVIPTNNKGRRALALIYWLLTRETLKAMNKITSDAEYKLTIEDFEAPL
ncbi:MAG: 30S ribosomal protein S2 [Thermoplasmata archaeon]